MNTTTIIFLSLAIIIFIIFLADFKIELKFKKYRKNKDKQEKEIKLDNLSNTELKLLKSLSYGKTNKEIAEEFSISVLTVKKHVSNIFKKLDISARKETRQFKDMIEKN